jgi:hypothetical protein
LPGLRAEDASVMARDTVLVIGAGASYGARQRRCRDESRQPPPLGAGLGKYLLDWYDANLPSDDDLEWSGHVGNPRDPSAPSEDFFEKEPDVRSVLVETAKLAADSKTPFEDIMSNLLREGSRDLLNKVNAAICFAMLCGRACVFERGKDLYDELFQRLGPSLRSIITPNYDLLAEEALERVSLSYRYRGVDGSGPDDASVVIDKFHGSVNWFEPLGIGRSASLAAAQAMTKTRKMHAQSNMPSLYNDAGLFATPGDRRKNAVCELKRPLPPSLVLVTYGAGKDAMFGRPHLDRVRSECASDLRRNPPRRVIAMGISHPRGGGDDDAWESLCQLFGSLDCAKEYWNPDASEREEMKAYGFEGREGLFEDLLRSIEP